MQKFIAVRKEDGGDYFCRAKNDAGFSQCPAQLMEVCKCVIDTNNTTVLHCELIKGQCFISPFWLNPTDDIDVLGIALGVLVVVIVLLCITVGICCAYKRGFFSSEKQTGNK